MFDVYVIEARRFNEAGIHTYDLVAESREEAYRKASVYFDPPDWELVDIVPKAEHHVGPPQVVVSH